MPWTLNKCITVAQIHQAQTHQQQCMCYCKTIDTKHIMNHTPTLATLPHPELTCLHDVACKSSYKTILEVQTKLSTNSASIDSIYCNHSHCFLMLSSEDFTVLNNGIPFDMPACPPVDPVHPAGATGLQIAKTNHHHEALWKACTLMCTVKTLLCSKLLAVLTTCYSCWSKAISQ